MRTQKLRTLLVSVAAVAVLGAVSAAPAMAKLVPATFSTGYLELNTPSIVIKKNGADPKTCTLTNSVPLGGEAFGQVAILSNNFAERAQFTCPSKTKFEITVTVYADYDDVAGKYLLTIKGPTPFAGVSPWGNFVQDSGTAVGTWVNGAGGKPSTVTFTDAKVGHLVAQSITMSGTFTAAGGTTLSH